MRLDTLVDFAIERGNRRASTPTERALVEKLQRKVAEDHFVGRDFDLQEYFPDLTEKKFWAAVFHDVGQAIFGENLEIRKLMRGRRLLLATRSRLSNVATGGAGI